MTRHDSRCTAVCLLFEYSFGGDRNEILENAANERGDEISAFAKSLYNGVIDNLEAVDETVDSTKCGGKSNCHNDQPCITHDLWMGLSEQIRSYLKQITLGQLLERELKTGYPLRKFFTRYWIILALRHFPCPMLMKLMWVLKVC